MAATNFFGMFSDLGAKAGKAVGALGQGVTDVVGTVEDYNKAKEQANFTNDLLTDARNLYGLSDTQLAKLPKDITADEAQEVVTSYRLITEANKTFKERFREQLAKGTVSLPSPKNYFGGDMSQAKEFIGILEKKAKQLDKEADIALGKQQGADIIALGEDPPRGQAAATLLAESGRFTPDTKTALGALSTSAQKTRAAAAGERAKAAKIKAWKGAKQSDIQDIRAFNSNVDTITDLREEIDDNTMILRDMKPQDPEYKSTLTSIKDALKQKNDLQSINDALKKDIDKSRDIPQGGLGPKKTKKTRGSGF